VKFTKQAFYGGDPERYGCLTSTDKTFMLPYLDNWCGQQQRQRMGKAFIDSTRRPRASPCRWPTWAPRAWTTCSTSCAHRPTASSPTKYKVTFTGTSVVFLKGSSYLVSNLITSLFWAIVIIVVLMALLFNSLRILVVALIPNMIPLIVTAGLMGFLHIPIKPSTMLVFGIALGIAVDNAIHFLARYRLELKLTGGDLAQRGPRGARGERGHHLHQRGAVSRASACSPSRVSAASKRWACSPPSPCSWPCSPTCWCCLRWCSRSTNAS
jgi:hypothetical protein